MKLAARPGVMLLTLLAALWLGSSTTRVHADPVDEARILFEAGVSASRAERWREAREYFKRSAALYEKPSTLFNLAVVEVKLGLGTEALVTIQAFERIATAEHDSMRHGAELLRGEAETQAKKQREGGSVLGEVHDSLVLEGEAAALFEAGKQAYWAGRYADALEYFERAEKLSKRPELLYDIGAAADRLRDDERALSALEAFLEADPSSPLAGHVRSRVEVLRRVVAERKHQTAFVANVLTPPLVGASELQHPAEAQPSQRAWTLLGVGAAVTAGAVGTFGWYVNRVNNRDKCKKAKDECTNLTDLDRQRKAALSVSVVLGSAGLAMLTAGTVLAVRQPRVGVGLSAEPGYAAVWLDGRF
jgi:tetratricopeptide (TPR) repeat protein